MTEAYASDLEDDTAFERLFLSTAFPMVDTAAWEAAGSFDPATGLAQVQVRASDHLGTTPASVVALLGIQPLALGAAWKGLDILVERALIAAGHAPGSGGRWTIAEKVTKARQAVGQAAPLSNDPPIWLALTSLYAETEQIRHSLVHRRVTKQADGSLVGITPQGSPLRPLTLAEQEFSCYALQRALDAVIAGSMSRRQRSDLAWYLDQLAGVHGRALIGGRQVNAVRRFAVPVAVQQGQFQFDGTQLKQRLGQRDTGQWIEVRFQTAGTGDLLADLDDIPEGQQSITLATPPTWARQP